MLNMTGYNRTFVREVSHVNQVVANYPELSFGSGSEETETQVVGE